MVVENVAPHVGCRFLVTDAKQPAVAFYEKMGFTLLDTDDNRERENPVMAGVTETTSQAVISARASSWAAARSSRCLTSSTFRYSLTTWVLINGRLSRIASAFVSCAWRHRHRVRRSRRWYQRSTLRSA